ncbi:hypothetical protein GCM10022251_75680 [Phytohabitans flavus]|uniref:Uncharacterized protein n=1 Tax=Phytohabitans flavus TaxID=1076124 RepID=A0A6F8XMG6_9ACTN|nr:hypothetical protein Pflav_014130 [Phytohabitans flavus]
MYPLSGHDANAPVAEAAALPSLSRDPSYVDHVALYRASKFDFRQAGRVEDKEHIDVVTTPPSHPDAQREWAEWRQARGERLRKQNVALADRSRVVNAARTSSVQYPTRYVARSAPAAPAKAPARAAAPAPAR